MLPGMGGRSNPKQLQAMMRQMGIRMEDIKNVTEVIIRTPDKEYVIAPAEVSKMTAQGQVTWQVGGDATIRSLAPGAADAAAGAAAGGAAAEASAAAAPARVLVEEEDVKLVMEQAGVDEATARQALEESDGQPAEALVKLLGDA